MQQKRSHNVHRAANSFIIVPKYIEATKKKKKKEKTVVIKETALKAGGSVELSRGR